MRTWLFQQILGIEILNDVLFRACVFECDVFGTGTIVFTTFVYFYPYCFKVIYRDHACSALTITILSVL